MNWTYTCSRWWAGDYAILIRRDLAPWEKPLLLLRYRAHNDVTALGTFDNLEAAKVLTVLGSNSEKATTLPAKARRRHQPAEAEQPDEEDEDAA